jgi:hypothetical protein
MRREWRHEDRGPGVGSGLGPARHPEARRLCVIPSPPEADEGSRERRGADARTVA